MSYNSETLHTNLNKYFGFDSFKDDQEAIIRSILEGHDTFVIMPTGGGKSLCYQLPAFISEGTALIISPLIALMKNQVDSIRGHSDNNDVAHFLNSSLNKGQINHVKEKIMSGETKMVFVAPESLKKEENIAFLKRANISFVAVDEAHCISEWGHDFRPEYRKIRSMIQAIGDQIPIIALTATATPKVQSDIVKNLNMKGQNTFISSFNRDNLYYEVRPKINKDQTIKNMVQFVKKHPGKSGIVYVQSRKSTEEIAKVLSINGINAAPYHAGLDNKVRSKIQDDFLMEEVDVIVATIAFGMGIDKPDVRFVIHYDIPKSIENYYQETGRAGRDGLEGTCLAFYTHKDIVKLEKFLKDKPVAEKELSLLLMDEVMGYSETGNCRRQYLLSYFGEAYDAKNCNNMCDNCKHPKEQVDAKIHIQNVLLAVGDLKENYGIKVLVDFILGNLTKDIKDYKFDKMPHFAVGKSEDSIFWYSMIRNAITLGYLTKEIEQYGVLKISEAGHAFLKNPVNVKVGINRDYENMSDEQVLTDDSRGAALDNVLLDMLKELRKSEAKKKKVQPWVIFLEPTLIEMATYYPINMSDLEQISGISKGKAIKYGKAFIELISDYVEQNNIERLTDVVIKQIANKSKSKINIIQGVDRKLPLEDLADNVKIPFEDLLDEMNNIVNSGTKLDINYYLEENLDEEVIENVFDYFDEADSESIESAFDELQEDDITLEEIKMVRVKYMTEIAN